MTTIDKVIGAIGALSSISAAASWLRSAVIEVPDNIDTIVRELQRIGWWNSAARSGCRGGIALRGMAVRQAASFISPESSAVGGAGSE